VIPCAGLDGDRASCDLVVYKDFADTPASAYELVGRLKPPS
jgi:hypothetical protein